jgi:cytochrome b
MSAQVWDPFIRVFHWLAAAGFLVNYWLIEDGPAHRWIGYGVAGLLVARILWGLVGTRNARFASFFPTPSRLSRYLAAIARGEHPPTEGHNPVGALMILTLLTLLSALVLSGWMMRWDLFWGVDWVEKTHKILATAIQILVVVHVSAIIFLDLVRHEGLLRAMVTGRRD